MQNLVNVVCKMRIFAPILWNLRKIYRKILANIKKKP